MLSAKDVAIVYETLLSSPGMNEVVKVALNLPRKQVLVLSKIIEAGIEAKGDGEKNGWLSMADESVMKEIAGINADLLQKAGLSEMNERIGTLIVKS
ncbi:MAG: hypothetical protein ACTHMC_22275 [Pseudobacter sp.]|uniref:hypothetical protein n=1 Tax=Pseudobacter sp. TaxID=2045420 RepID=UPI003F81FAC9